ncbi:hypothetical protein [Acutalibacter sp. JLR.KK004]|uniref:hypothetical protein n=1 Tax=Acutalibacter sp. JLR.KK004 TaxID=3112622 RepID=UPI002FF22363
MAGIEFKPGMKKDELLEIAALNGIEADDSMTKTQIMDALKAAGAAQTAEQPENGPQSGADGGETSGQGNDTHGGENAVQSGTEGQQDAPSGGIGNSENGDGKEAPAESPQSGADGGDGSGEDNNTTPPEKPAEGKQEAQQGYNLFVYAGPSLPRGRLKENTVFRGAFEDVKNYLSDALEDYPQIEKLIVPADKLAAFSIKVKTPGNIAHKYYSDIVSAMRGNKEV